MNRKARRIARRTAAPIIRMTLAAWNPAQEAAWRDGYGSPAAARFADVNLVRGAMCLDRVRVLAAAGVDDRGAMRRTLRRIEARG